MSQTTGKQSVVAANGLHQQVWLTGTKSHIICGCPHQQISRKLTLSYPEIIQHGLQIVTDICQILMGIMLVLQIAISYGKSDSSVLPNTY